MPHNKTFCQPLNPFKRRDPEVKKVYIYYEYALTISYVCIPIDVPVIIDWLTPKHFNNLWKNESPLVELTQIYQECLESDSGQSFIIHIKTGKKTFPVCQVDVHQMFGRNALHCWDAQPGDYSVRIILSPQLQRFRNALFNILQLFFEYAFQFPEVKRMIAQLDEGYQAANDMLIRAGFDRINRIQMVDHKVNVYSCTREGLAGRGLHVYSLDYPV